MKRLPLLPSKKAKLTSERLFKEQFLHLYPPGASLEIVRGTDANPAKNPAIEAAAFETAELFGRLAGEALDAPMLELDGTDDSIHRLSAALTTAARERLFSARTQTGEPPLLVHFVAHGALYVAACIVRNHGGEWLMRSPLWETRVRLRSRAGEAELSPFSWWLAALSDDGIDKHALADRYRTLVEVPCEDVSVWPVVFPVDARYPRLSRPKYDTWVKFLETHLPEVTDLGPDFPSPQRFTELGLFYLETRVVGGGRALVVHGPTEKGIHLFWLGPTGFSKAVFVEADLVPEHRVASGKSSDGDETLTVSFCQSGVPRELELLWWGP